MSKEPGAIEVSHGRTIDAFHKALDQTYRHLLEAAKSDWKRLFRSDDGSDGCVSVRVSTEQIAHELAGIPRASGLPIKQSKAVNGKVHHRLA